MPANPHTGLYYVGKRSQALVYLDRADAAEPLIREAVAICRRQLGDRHPRTLEQLTHLAVALNHLDKVKEAEKRLLEVLEARDVLIGVHSDVLIAATSLLAFVLERRDEHDTAETHRLEALPLARARWGADHPRVGYETAQLGWNLLLSGRAEDAERLFLESLDLIGRESFFAITDPARGLARSLVEQGEYKEAESLYKWILATMHRDVRADSSWFSYVNREFGRCLTRMERYDEAEVLLLKSYQWMLSNKDAGHEGTHHVIGRIVELYEAWAKPAQAAKWRARLPKEQESLASDPPAEKQEE